MAAARLASISEEAGAAGVSPERVVNLPVAASTFLYDMDDGPAVAVLKSSSDASQLLRAVVPISQFSAATDGRNDRNLATVRNRARESAGVAHVFVPNEDIDMFANFSLLRCHARANARVQSPQSR